MLLWGSFSNGQEPEIPKLPESIQAELDRLVKPSRTERDSSDSDSEKDGDKKPAKDAATPPPPSKAIRPESLSLADEPKFNDDALQLSDVIASVYRAFPLIEIARIQDSVARGEIQSALGAYDTKIDYYSLNQPIGFYETYRQGIGAARQLWWGGYLAAGYRIGRGTFEPWYQERVTNEGGELSLNVMQPLLRGRAIDAQRVELFQAQLRRQAVGPEVQFNLLVAGRDAAFAYWDWVENGLALKAQQQLLKLAQERKKQLEEELKALRGTKFRVLANDIQITDREIKVNNRRLKYQNAAYKLAMFLRDESGQPMIPPPEWLPADFPEVDPISLEDFEQAYNNALRTRPELQLISFEVQQTRLALDLARNDTLPNVDLTVEASQDLGQRSSPKNDKGHYEMMAGIVGGVPVQRNKAFGKIQSLTGKLNQLASKQQFTQNKIFSELNQARENLETYAKNVELAKQLVRQNIELLKQFQLTFQSGNFQILLLIEQETKVTESEVALLEAEQLYYASLAALQATLGLDPLDQAALVTVP